MDDETTNSGEERPADQGAGAFRSRGRDWWNSRQPVFRFVAGFLLLIGPFTLFFYGFLIRTGAFEWYLELNAAVSAAILRMFGEDATAAGTLLGSPRAKLEIRHGCDAIMPTAIFVSGILASPVLRGSKLLAVAIGSSILLALNLVRIISLYYTQIHFPEWFHTMHVDVWQPAFIVLALVLWVVWALRATRPSGGSAPRG